MKPSIACLLAVQAVASGIAASVTLDVTLTITPDRRSRMCGMIAWHIAMTPNVFVAKTLRICAMGVASNAPTTPMPALLTSTSIGPAAATVAAMLVTRDVERQKTQLRRTREKACIGPAHRGDDSPPFVEKMPRRPPGRSQRMCR